LYIYLDTRGDILSVSINLKEIYMDGESYRESEKKGLNRDSCTDVGNIFQPPRVRCSICVCDEIDRFLLDYGFNFLPYIGSIIYIVLLIKATL
jgi:hypothetical protein